MQYVKVLTPSGISYGYPDAALLVDHTGTLRVVRHPIAKTGPAEILAAFPPTQYASAHVSGVVETDDPVYMGASGIEVANATSRKT